MLPNPPSAPQPVQAKEGKLTQSRFEDGMSIPCKPIPEVPNICEKGLAVETGPVGSPLGAGPVYCGVRPVPEESGSLRIFPIDAGYEGRLSNIFALFGVNAPVLNMPSVMAAECSGATLESSWRLAVAGYAAAAVANCAWRKA